MGRRRTTQHAKINEFRNDTNTTTRNIPKQPQPPNEPSLGILGTKSKNTVIPQRNFNNNIPKTAKVTAEAFIKNVVNDDDGDSPLSITTVSASPEDKSTMQNNTDVGDTTSEPSTNAVVNSGEPSSDDHDDVHKDSHPNQSASSPFDETNDTSDSRLVIVEEDEEPAAASSASSATSSPRKSILRNKGVRRKRQLTSILQVSRSGVELGLSSEERPTADYASQSGFPGSGLHGGSGVDGRFTCPSCNKVVLSQSEYTRHIRQHNIIEASATTHSCSLCGKALSSTSSLDRHMLVHSGERPFKCRMCGMAFTTNGNMHRHMRTHHDGGVGGSVASSATGLTHPGRKPRALIKRKRLQQACGPRPINRLTGVDISRSGVLGRGKRNGFAVQDRMDEEMEEEEEEEEEELDNSEDRELEVKSRNTTEQVEEEEEDVVDEEEDKAEMVGGVDSNLYIENGRDCGDEDDNETSVNAIGKRVSRLGNRFTSKKRKFHPLDGRRRLSEKFDDSTKTNVSNNNFHSQNSNSFEVRSNGGGVGILDNDEDTLQCIPCGKSFLCRKGLVNHQEGHDLRCLECRDSREFPSYQDLVKHFQAFHGSGRVGDTVREADKRTQDVISGAGSAAATFVGFDDLTFVDFTTLKFSLIAKSACEQNIRCPGGNVHVFQCRHCNKAFPSEGSLKLHLRGGHPPLKVARIHNGNNEIVTAYKKTKSPKCGGVSLSPVKHLTCACEHCHASFASQHQLEVHSLRHQEAEQCATPYSADEDPKRAVVPDRRIGGPVAGDSAPGESLPMLDKENFMALLELQSRTRDPEKSSTGFGDALLHRPTLCKTHHGLNEQSGGELDLQTSKRTIRTSSPLVSETNDVGGGGGDFADIQSILAVTSTAGIMPSVMILGSSPVSARNASPPPSESPASPRPADSVTASPELPSECVKSSTSPLGNELPKTGSLSKPNIIPSSDVLTSDQKCNMKPQEDASLNDKKSTTEENGGLVYPKVIGCDQCSPSLPSLRALRTPNHCTHVDSSSPFHCTMCSYVSSERSTLTRHLRTHNGDRPYLCAICQYAFTTKANCERHLRKKHGLITKVEVCGAMKYRTVSFLSDGQDHERCGHHHSATLGCKGGGYSCHQQPDDQGKPFIKHLPDQPADGSSSSKPCSHQNFHKPVEEWLECRCHPRPEAATSAPLPPSLLSKSLPSSAQSLELNRPRSTGAITSNNSTSFSSPLCSLDSSPTRDSDVAVSSATVLDLSSNGENRYISCRPASYPGAGPRPEVSFHQCERVESLLDQCSSLSSSSLESLTSLSNEHYECPPQEQPLDLALYPIDLSIGSVSPSPHRRPEVVACSTPMDLSSSHPRMAFGPSLTPTHSCTPQTPGICGTSPDVKKTLQYGSPSPFQSRAPLPCFVPQLGSPPSPGQSLSPHRPTQPSPVSQRSLPATAYVSRVRPRFNPPTPSICPSSKDPVDGVSNVNRVASIGGPGVTPLYSPLTTITVTTNDVPPSVMRQGVVRTVAMGRPSSLLQTAPVMRQTPPPSAPAAPSVSVCLKTEPRGIGSRGDIGSNGTGNHQNSLPLSNNAGTAAAGATTAGNRFLLKKQKQRRYRTERPFKCAHCAAGFTLRSNMERHIKQQHPEFWSSKSRSRNKIPTLRATASTSSVGQPPPPVVPPTTVSTCNTSTPPTISALPTVATLAQFPQHPLSSLVPAFPDLKPVVVAPSASTQSCVATTTLESAPVFQHYVPHPQTTPTKNLGPTSNVVVPKIELSTKTIISPEVKQAISQQIKQRKNLEHVPASAVSAYSLLTAKLVPATSPTSLTLSNSNTTPLVVESTVRSATSLLIPSTIKVTETIFPPSLAASVAGTITTTTTQDDNSGGTNSNGKVSASYDACSSGTTPQPVTLCALPDPEDTTPDLASVSMLIDTAARQNIQEMLRHPGAAEEDDEGMTTRRHESLAMDRLSTPKSVDNPHSPAGVAGVDECPSSGVGLQEVPSGSGQQESHLQQQKTPSSSSNRSPKEGRRRSAYNSAPNRVACPYCRRLFPWTSSLRRHILTHTGQKPFKCPHCPLWFTTKSNCDRHLARKHGSCPQDWTPDGPSSSVGVTLSVTPTTISSSTHTTTGDCSARNAPDRPYRCTLCLSSTFATPGNLKKHMETKHAPPPTLQQPPQPENPPAAQLDETHSEEHHQPVHVASMPFETIGGDPPLSLGLTSEPVSDHQEDDDHRPLVDDDNAMVVKSEVVSEAGSNSGSERCWGESEESGEDGVPDSSRQVLPWGPNGEALYFCFVCLESFAIREKCLEHLQTQHPAEHAKTTAVSNAEDSGSGQGAGGGEGDEEQSERKGDGSPVPKSQDDSDSKPCENESHCEIEEDESVTVSTPALMTTTTSSEASTTMTFQPECPSDITETSTSASSVKSPSRD